jgi:hypothetical protein
MKKALTMKTKKRIIRQFFQQQQSFQGKSQIDSVRYFENRFHIFLSVGRFHFKAKRKALSVGHFGGVSKKMCQLTRSINSIRSKTPLV